MTMFAYVIGLITGIALGFLIWALPTNRDAESVRQELEYRLKKMEWADSLRDEGYKPIKSIPITINESNGKFYLHPGRSWVVRDDETVEIRQWGKLIQDANSTIRQTHESTR